MPKFANTTQQEVFDYLMDKAADHGENNVRMACREFLKKKSIAGVPRTERKPVPRAWTEEMFLKQNGRCGRCKKEIMLSEAEGDHIVPLEKGGPHTKSNIQALCKPCNASKGANDFITESKATGRTFLQQLTQS